MNDTLFVNVDTQYDFMREGRKLPVPGAENVEDKLYRLTEKAKDDGYRIVNTADWHNEDSDELSDDPDFQETFPEHCMQGTEGAEYVPATEPDDPYVVDWQQDDVDLDEVNEQDEIVLYKDLFNVFEGNPHADQVFDSLDEDTAVVYGVASDVCVDYAVNGLLERGWDVYAVTDATAGLGEDDEIQATMQAWEDRGAELVTTDEILDRL